MILLKNIGGNALVGMYGTLVLTIDLMDPTVHFAAIESYAPIIA